EGEEEELDETWKVLDQDLRSLRSELLEPELLHLAAQPARFTQLREEWRRAAAPRQAAELKDVLSEKGVTLVATLQPRTVALHLAGKIPGDPAALARWAEEARSMRARVKDAAAAKRAADKARERAAKRGDEEGRAGARDDGMSGAGRVALRPGLVVSADEAEEVEDDDTLVMLSRGVAYAASRGVEPLVKRLYQQALLYVPERAGVRPPLHTLVVDYSAVYGTDCPAVDTIVLCEDLAAVMSWEDHQQFMGRLRRDGTAVYPSMDRLRRAVLGGSSSYWEEQRRRRAGEQRRRVEEVLAKHVTAAAAGAADTTAAAARELLQLVRPAEFPRAAVAAHVLTAALRDLVAPADGGDGGGGDTRALLAAALRRLKQWGGLKPLKLIERLRLERPAEQRLLVAALQALCLGTGAAAAANADGDGDGAADNAAGGEGAAVGVTQRYLPCAARLLQELANEDVVEQAALSL
ncbi:hypothetical protein Agub_g8379, partial [Astrephomene gubernaculifera]